MVVEPAAKPVTTPVLLTDATDVVLLLHTPPLVASVSVVVKPAQTVDVPVMVPALGVALTVTAFVAAAVPQVLVTVYEMVAEPAAKPFTKPDMPTEAIAGAVLLHVPPTVTSEKAVDVPVQIEEAPEIAATDGTVFTVTAYVAVAVPHVPANVYVMVAVPAATPVTTPVLLTLAIIVLDDDHAPPKVTSDSVMLAPVHTVLKPVIGETVPILFTVIALVA